MRIYFLLIFLAITMAFTSGYFSLYLQKDTAARKSDIERIKEIKSFLEKVVRPLTKIDLISNYSRKERLQLIQPATIDPTLQVFAALGEQIRSTPCRRGLFSLFPLDFMDKSTVWDIFRCGNLPTLPPDFFIAPPYIHSSGFSYAFLTFSLNRPPYDKQWALNNVSAFHLGELNLLKKEIGSLPGIYDILSTLDFKASNMLLTNSQVIINDDYFFMRVGGLEYNIYSKKTLLRYINNSSYRVRLYKDGQACFYKDGNGCWEPARGGLSQLFSRTTTSFFAGSIVFIFLIFMLLYGRIKKQKVEEERKKHALRVLTHELRTPVTSLLLSIERINKNSDKITDDILEDLIRIESDIYRLKRLAEKGRSYLEVQGENRIIHFELIKIDSVNDYLGQIIESFHDQVVEVTPLDPDRPFTIDTYWVGICIKNLLENAFRYGKAPVRLRPFVDKEILNIEITDDGSCVYSDIKQMCKMESVDYNGQGLGLGLSIVKKTIEEMGGQITLSSNPTTFTLQIPDMDIK